MLVLLTNIINPSQSQDWCHCCNGVKSIFVTKCYFNHCKSFILGVSEVTGSGHLRRNNCGATIVLAIALAPQLFLTGCADAFAASILAVLSAIVQAQFKYD